MGPTSSGGAELSPVGGSYLMPSIEHATVGDVFRPGVIGCPADASMEQVARIMAMNHVHAVVVSAGDSPWAVVTDQDVLAVAAEAPERLAGSCASGDVVKVTPQDRLTDAAELMRRHRIAHVLVVDGQRGEPVGMLSTLDVAGCVAWGRA